MTDSPRTTHALSVFRQPPARLNCAQAVFHTFEAEGLAPSGSVESCQACGGGRVEGGFCGALFAARQLVPDATGELDAAFEERAGSLRCREIRAAGHLSCQGCVSTAVELVEHHRKAADSN
jgi:hypothetical protein